MYQKKSNVHKELYGFNYVNHQPLIQNLPFVSLVLININYIQLKNYCFSLIILII